ncbi:unnamed protein product [Rotaria sp. Silwood2]|nr:unnamed protein product [Rotaria sp. Silwood2]
MSRLSASHTTQHTSRISNNPNNERSFVKENYSPVRQAIRKYDKFEKFNDISSVLPPPRPPPLRPPISIQTRNNNINHDNETPPSSMSSSLRSTNSDVEINQNSIEKLRSQLHEISTKNSTPKIISPTKSTPRIDIQIKKQSKPTNRRRRTPPPIPSNTPDYSAAKQNTNDGLFYVKNYTQFDKYHNENQENDSYELPYENDSEGSEECKDFSNPVFISKVPQTSSNLLQNVDHESVGLEISDTIITNRRNPNTSIERDDDRRTNVRSAPSTITKFEQHRVTLPSSSHRSPPPLPPPPKLPSTSALPSFREQQQRIAGLETQEYTPRTFLPLSNFMMEIGALLVVFIICMVLVLAIREDESNLRTTLQLVYTYIYAVSIVWMVWCTFDIIKFRRQWRELTAPAHNNEEYMDISERHTHKIFYFPDVHNTGGLFMRIGAGLFCMGSLIVTVIELAKTIATGTDIITRASPTVTYPMSVVVTKSMTYILRFLFHCVQFTFLFRYGNIVINRYRFIARIGLIHLIIANFCTWFEAIVFETLEQLHKSPTIQTTINYATNVTYLTTITTPVEITSAVDNNNSNNSFSDFIKEMSAATSQSDISINRSSLDIIKRIESTMNVYLYPCLIEYSLISLTVFFLMWRNVGRISAEPFLRFGDRHVFTINCARASRGLLIGGIILLLTILTLIPTYLLNEDAISVTHITELILLTVSLCIVCMSFLHTTKLYYNPKAHVDAFDQVLILITTVGDFAYSFFGLFASIFVDRSKSKLPIGIEISIGFLAIFQTFLQSGFILDTLKRRVKSKFEIRNKPGRETITALLLINLAIWLHDSLSAKKVRLNPLQVEYYDAGTWAIIQAFTSPLSIFYRFHSSVCLADIWQEVYSDRENNDGIKQTRIVGRQHSLNMDYVHDTEH